MSLASSAIGLLEGSLVVVGLWLILRVARSVSPDTRAWLWRLAILKLALPALAIFQITLHVLPAPPPPAQPQPITTLVTPPATQCREVPLAVNEPVIDAKPAARDHTIATRPQAIDPTLMLAVAWGLGLALFAGRAVRDTARARKALKKAVPIQEGSVAERLERLAKSAGLRSLPRLVRSEIAAGPLVTGILRPTIVLPPSIMEGSEEDLRLALAHEIAHIRRRDLAWSLVGWLIRSVLFFNPAAWLAASELRATQESATDQEAVWITGASVGTYGLMLLRAMSRGRDPWCPPGLAMSVSFADARRRLDAMKGFTDRRRPFGGALTFALVVVGLGFLPTYLIAPAIAASNPPTERTAISQAQTPSGGPRNLTTKPPARPNTWQVIPPARKLSARVAQAHVSAGPTERKAIKRPLGTQATPHIQLVEEKPTQRAQSDFIPSEETQKALKEAADAFNQRVQSLLVDQDARIAEYREGADQREREAEQRESEAQRRKREGEQRARAALLRAQVIHLRRQDDYRHAAPGQEEEDKRQLAADQRQKEADAYQSVLDQHQRETDQWQRDFDARTITAMKNETQRNITTARAAYQKRIQELVADEITRRHEALGAESFTRGQVQSVRQRMTTLHYVTSTSGLRFAIPNGFEVAHIEPSGKGSYTVVLRRMTK